MNYIVYPQREGDDTPIKVIASPSDSLEKNYFATANAGKLERERG